MRQISSDGSEMSDSSDSQFNLDGCEEHLESDLHVNYAQAFKLD